MIRNSIIESELGRIPCTVTSALASSLQPKEHINSIGMEELLLLLPTELSIRKSDSILNRLLRRSDKDTLKKTTLEDFVERKGVSIAQGLQDLAGDILSGIPGMSLSGKVVNIDMIPESIKNPFLFDERYVDNSVYFGEWIDAFNDTRESPFQIKDIVMIDAVELNPANVVYVSIDEIGVRHQKDIRQDGGSKKGKVIENTVIHIEANEGTYILTAVGMDQAFRLLMAFLLENHMLENRHLHFFTDGAVNIRNHIETYFGPLCPYELTLDWYHLEKKMTELFSMSLKGGKDRKEFEESIFSMLWAGNFDDAIEHIENIDAKYIKNQRRLDEVIAYLERKKEFGCCYALRNQLGYRNSSNPVEKANDIIVANRQKHNGMSWSWKGSGSLAVITAMNVNGELSSWLRDGTIAFAPVSQENLMAA